MKNSAKARSVSAFALDQPANGCPDDREARGHSPRQLAANENLLAWRARFPAARVREYEYKLGQYAFPTPLTPLPKRFPGRNFGKRASRKLAASIGELVGMTTEEGGNLRP